MKKFTTLLMALIICLFAFSNALTQTTWDSDNLAWKQNKDPITFSLYHNMTWAPMDVWGKDHVSQRVTEDTGISFDVEIQSNAQQLATYVAGGQLPEAVFVFGGANKDLLENYDICYAWDELIDQYAPEMWDLIDKSDIQLATKSDGHFYTLYTHVRNQEYWDDPGQGVSYGENVLSFRQDVLEELGNPEINTVDDLYNVLKAAKELHPEMVIYVQPELNGTYLSRCFGVPYSGTQGAATINDNGEAEWVFSQKDVLSPYLEFANKLFREGLLSQESLTYDQEQCKAAVMAGNVFCYAGQAYDVDQWNKALDAVDGNKVYYVALRKILTVDGELLVNDTWGSPGFAGFYITRNCKEPGRLIALMEYMRSPYADKLTQWGVPELDYDMVDGFPVQNEDYSWKERGDNVWYFQASFAVENMKALGTALKDERFAQTAHLVLDYKPYWKYDVNLSLIANAEANTYEGDVFATLDNLRKTRMSSIITAKTEEECKQGIEEFFAALDSAELDVYNKFLNDQYQAIKSRNAE